MKVILRKLMQVLSSERCLIACVACGVLTAVCLYAFATHHSPNTGSSMMEPPNYMVMDRFDQYATNSFSDSLDGVMSIKKAYWLSDSDKIAPKPNPTCYGETDDPLAMQEVLDRAAALLDGQETLFKTDVKLCPGSKIRYYYDPTILVITWQEVRGGCVYTISEVKIAHASQLRRFLSGGEYGSGMKLLSSEMAKTVNAVVASNGDYYAMRHIGTVVQNGQLLRMEGGHLDSCYIDDQGDLLFLKANTITERTEMEQYIEDHHIRFSISFGPILVENGVPLAIDRRYAVGEVTKFNERAALCQKGMLHYLLVMENPQPPYRNNQTLWQFAEQLQLMGVEQAYNLDGGRSGTIVFNGERINYVEERKLSDIIYFATAIPNGA